MVKKSFGMIVLQLKEIMLKNKEESCQKNIYFYFFNIYLDYRQDEVRPLNSIFEAYHGLAGLFKGGCCRVEK